LHGAPVHLSALSVLTKMSSRKSLSISWILHDFLINL
jgi:hypothetical protein